MLVSADVHSNGVGKLVLILPLFCATHLSRTMAMRLDSPFSLLDFAEVFDSLRSANGRGGRWEFAMFL